MAKTQTSKWLRDVPFGNAYVNNPYTVTGKTGRERATDAWAGTQVFRPNYNPANIQNSIAVWLRGGSGPGGVSRPAISDTNVTQNWFLGPNGVVLPYTQDAADQAALGQAPSASDLIAGYASSPGSSNRVDVPGILTPDGQIVTPDPDTTAKKFADAKQNAYNEIIRQRLATGQGMPGNPAEELAVQQQAEQQAMSDLSVYIGSNSDNYPKSVAGPMAVPEYKPGQFFPTFDSAGPRSITATEAQALNFIKNSGQVPDPNNVLAYLFDPRVTNEQKASILGEVATAMGQAAVQTPTASDALEWSWNPLEMTGRVLMKGLDLVGAFYEDLVIPSFTWTVSAAPGGPRTASWQEAQSIAPGQMMAAAVDPRISAWMSNTTMPFSMLGAAIEGTTSGNWDNFKQYTGGYYNSLANNQAPWKGMGDAIYDPQQRQQLFVDDFYGSQLSGGIGFAVNIVWDPLWLAGGAGKLLRVSHVLGMGAGAIRTLDDAAKLDAQLMRGTAVFRRFDLARKQLDAATRYGDEEAVRLATTILDSARSDKNLYINSRASSPIERFVNWIVDPADGKPRTASQIREHAVIYNATFTDAAATALVNSSKSFEEAALIVRSGYSNDALQAVRDLSVKNEEILRRAHVETQVDNMLSAPDKYMQAYGKVYSEVQDAAAEVRRLEQSILPEPIRPVRSNPPVEGQVVDGYSQRFFEGFGPEARRRDLVRVQQEFYRTEDLAEEMRLEAKLSEARLANVPQEQVDDLVRQLDEARAISRQNFFARAEGVVEPEELRMAQRKLSDAITKLHMLDNAQYGVVRSPEQVAMSRAVLEDAIRRDEMLRSAIEAGNFMRNSRQVNFGRGRLQSMANAREGVRQRKAERKAFQKETHRGANPVKGFGQNGWVRQSFQRGMDNPGIVVWSWAGGAREAAADILTRPLTYAAMESPAGYMTIARGSYTENYREAEATLNNIKMYGDNEVWATLPDGTAVTGRQRKEDILNRFIRDINDPGKDPAAAVRSFEKDIIMDMARKYAPGADREQFYKDISEMYAHLDSERSSLIDMIKNEHFWVDENGTTHVSPFLESQLAQGMPLADFRRMERLVRGYATKGRRLVRSGVQRRYSQAAEEAQGQLTLGEERLAKLQARAERLGTMAEGRGLSDMRDLAKAAAAGDQFAIKLQGAIRDTSVSISKTERNVRKLEESLHKALRDESIVADKELGPGHRFQENAIAWYDQFQTLWRAGVLFRFGYPVRNSIDGLARRIAFEASLVPVLQDAVQGSRNIVSNAIAGRVSTEVPFIQRMANARKARLAGNAESSLAATGTLPKRVVSWADREADRITVYRDNVWERRQALDKVIEELRGASDGLDDVAREALDRRVYDLVSKRRAMDADVERLNKQLKPFEEGNEAELILAYRQSLDRPRRIGDEFVFGVSGEMYYGMLTDPRYGAILAEQVSARETQQASLGLGLDIARSTMRAATITAGSVVEPGAPNYYEALALVLNRHVSNSVVGDLWLRGIKAPDAARILMRREGERWRMNAGVNAGKQRYVRNVSKKRRKAAKAANKERDIKATVNGDTVKMSEAAEVRDMEMRLAALERERDSVSTKLGSKKNRDRHEELNAEITKLREELAGRDVASVMGRTIEDSDVALTAHWMAANGLHEFDDVLDTVRYIFDEFDRIAPNPAVKQAMLNGQVSPEFLRTALSSDKWQLAAVHGEDVALLGGSKKVLSVLEKINPTISRVYSLIGSMPEDLVVRIPFASRRYTEAIQTGSRFLAAYYPEGDVPAWAVESMLKQARARAIKDTKTYMYTQDRRTNFGRVLERYIPFVSAWQNSVMAYSKMIKMNPEMLYYFEQAYLAPDRLGLVDKDGNVRIPIPKALAPVTDAMGYSDEWVYDKKSLYVLPSQVDPLLTFRAGPIIQMAASTLMQASVVGPVVPQPLVAVAETMGLSRDQAQQAWDIGAGLTFGTDSETGRPLPPSTIWGGFDKALPPALLKFSQLVFTNFGNTPENNAIFASHYTRIAREEMLKYMQGERDTLPTMDEVASRARALYMTRILTNMFGVTGGPFGLVTPPNLDSNIYSMQETYRLVQDVVGYDQADTVFTSLFGDEAMLLANYSGTRSRGGMPVSVDAFARAEQNKDLVAAIAANMDPEGLSILGFMLNDGSFSSQDYNESIRVRQLTANIPGTTIPWRETLSPQEQTKRASIENGWMMYTQTMQAIYADMQARGLKSLNAADAKPLLKVRNDFLERMRTDPLYAAWHKDYEDGAIKRIGGAIDFMRTVLSDQKFMSGPGTNEQDMWGTAAIWLAAREQYKASIQSVRENSDVAASALRERWAEESAAIAETNTRFNEFWVRYLDNDDLTVD